MNAKMKLIKTKMDLADLYEIQKEQQESLLFTQQLIKLKEDSLPELEEKLIKEKELNEFYEYNAWLLGINLNEIKKMYKL